MMSTTRQAVELIQRFQRWVLIAGIAFRYVAASVLVGNLACIELAVRSTHFTICVYHVICILRLGIPGLDIPGKYQQVVARFVKDMQFVQSQYNEHKHNPPLARNLPPVSGKIAWSRQLYQRISGPVEVFQQIPELMQLPATRKAIKSYNRLAQVLVEYEIVFLQIWTQQIAQARSSLEATLLVRNPSDGTILVNFDQKITELLRDIQVLSGMGVEVPTNGLLVYAKKHTILEHHDTLQVRMISETTALPR